MQQKTFYLSSTSNEHVKRWRRLGESTRAVKKFGTTLAEGLHLAQVICERGIAPRAVILSEACSRQARELALAAAGLEAQARIYELPPAVYDQVCPVENGTGIMIEVPAVLADRPMQPSAADALYLDGVQDAGNVGTLIRTAVAAGVRHIAASRDTAGFWTPKVLRAGMGAHFAARLYENVDVEDILELVEEKNRLQSRYEIAEAPLTLLSGFVPVEKVHEDYWWLWVVFASIAVTGVVGGCLDGRKKIGAYVKAQRSR